MNTIVLKYFKTLTKSNIILFLTSGYYTILARNLFCPKILDLLLCRQTKTNKYVVSISDYIFRTISRRL